MVVGDEVYNLDGTTAVITDYALEKLDEPITVYNFEVEDFHTYFVGESNVLVHNTCGVEVNEVTTYDDFTKRSVIGDELEGHKIWQHANLNENGYATTRLSTDASRQNPIIALPHEVHVSVNRAQRLIDARNQSPVQNILSNAQILYDNPNVPNDAVDSILTKALEHAAKFTK